MKTILSILLLLSLSSQGQTTYRIASGTNPASSYTLNNGDSLLWERGGVWKLTSLLPIYCNGTDSTSIYIGAYTGTHGSALPIINTKDTLPGWTRTWRWVAVKGDTVWKYTLPFNLAANYRLWFNGVEQTRAYMDYTASAVRDSVNQFQTFTTNRTYDLTGIYVYSPHVNPASYYSSIEYVGAPTNTFEIDYSGWTMRDLDIRGGSVATVKVINGSKFSINNCKIGVDAAHTGLDMNGAMDASVHHNEIESGDRIKHTHLYQDGVGDGILLGKGWHNLYIHNNYVHDWGHSNFEILTLGVTTQAWHYRNGLLGSNLHYYDNLSKAANVDYCRHFALDVDTSVGNSLRGRHEVWVYRNFMDSSMAQSQADCEGAVYAYNVIANTRNPSNYEYASNDAGWGIAMQSYNLTTARRQWFIGNTHYRNQSGAIKISANSYSNSYDSVTGNQFINEIYYRNGWDGNNETGNAHVNGVQVMNESYTSPSNLGTQTFKNNLFLTDDTTHLFFNNHYTYPNFTKTFSYFNSTAGTDLGWTINNNIYGDALFTDAANGDYTLTATSPGLLAGYNASDYSLPNGLKGGSSYPNNVLSAANTSWNIGAFVEGATVTPTAIKVYTKGGKVMVRGGKLLVKPQ